MKSIVRLSLILITAIDCGHSTARTAVQARCDAGLVTNYSPDSSVSICLPVGFTAATGATESHVRWVRGPIQSVEHTWLSVSLDTARESDSRWPPHLASPVTCLADCATADSVRQYRDTVTSGILNVEMGLVSGGYPGFQRQPLLVAGGMVPRGRVWVNGLAMKAATLDTLRRALRTLQFRE